MLHQQFNDVGNKRKIIKFKLLLHFRITVRSHSPSSKLSKASSILEVSGNLWATEKIQWMFREYKWAKKRLMSSEYVLLKSKAVSRWHSRQICRYLTLYAWRQLKFKPDIVVFLEEGYLKE